MNNYSFFSRFKAELEKKESKEDEWMSNQGYGEFPTGPASLAPKKTRETRSFMKKDKATSV